MLPVSYYDPDGSTSPKFAYAFAKGCGGTITDEIDHLFPGPVACFGSPPLWPLLHRAWDAKRDVFFGDHGYFGRKKFYRITKNAFNHDGTGHATPERFAIFNRPVQPWTKDGSHILICPNSGRYFELHGLDVDRWLVEVRETLAQHTDRPIRIRWKMTASPIEEDLINCWAVVVFSSAAATDALIAGVPCFTLAPFAATVRMGHTDLSLIETPFYPDNREPFLWNLADHQWTIKEMFAGVAWRALRDEAFHAAA